jgi:hypothetical protein
MKEENVFTPARQDDYFLNTLPLIRRIAARKLRGHYHHAVEGIIQRVALKLWRWKLRYPQKELSADEWQRLANSATQNEVKNFYSSRLRKEISLSEISEEEIVVLNKTQIEMPGDTSAELRSLQGQLWTAMQQLSVRQKYALLFRNADYIIDLIGNEVSSLREIAAALELSTEELKEIIVNLPLSDERIKKLLETKLQERITVKQVWAARNKAKLKLRNALRISNKNGADTKKLNDEESQGSYRTYSSGEP